MSLDTNNTRKHTYSATMVEHKEESTNEFDSTASKLYVAKLKRERKDTQDTVNTIHTVASSVEEESEINNRSPSSLYSPPSTSKKSHISLHSVFNVAGPDVVDIIPENDEINLSEYIGSMISGGYDHFDDLKHLKNGSSFKGNKNRLRTDENELNDDNIDQHLFSYNLRPILFVLLSIFIIYIPTKIIIDNIILYYIHLSYLLINIILFMILIPLYSKCVPESTDSIIANGGNSLNREPPQRIPLSHSINNSGNSDDDNDDNNNNDINDNHREQQQHNINSCHILYSFDAFYNRFFNIRNISYDVGSSVINFDSKIYNKIPIQFAGGFLIISNIVILICYFIDDDDQQQQSIINNMKSQATFLIFISMIIVSFTLFCQISIHFTQIKDDLRKTISNDIYVERLESNIQILTEERIFNNTFITKIIYAISICLSVILWIIYYKVYDKNEYKPSLNKNFVLFILILYTIIFVHLVFRLIILYLYSIIIVKQFSKPIRVKTMHQVITYWKLRHYYIDFVLYAFIALFHRILTFFFIIISISLIYLYIFIKIIDDNDDDDDDNNTKYDYLAIYILIVYIMCFTLYALNIASEIYISQKKHAKMINQEVVYIKAFQYKSQYTEQMKSVMKTNDILSLMTDIRANILNCTEYIIAGIPINQQSEVIIRFSFIIFSIIIFSYFV